MTTPADEFRTAARAQTLRDVTEICDEAGAVYTSKALNEHADAAYTLMERFQRKAEEAEQAAAHLEDHEADKASLLHHLHPEIQTLITAFDALRNGWADADEPTRQKLWDVVNEAQEVVSPTADRSLQTVIADVIAERHRQDAKWGVQDWHDFEGISILTEEVGEAAQAANEANFSSGSTPGDFTNLRAELVQVSAVAVHHVQIIDRRPKAQP